jgi:predicted enzyme related to lactoylglutathione lyase
VLLGVNKVRLGVVDQERARRFWVETIGCEVVQDESYGDERWLEVRLPDGVVLVLERHKGPDESAAPGQPNTPIFFGCDDVDSTSRDLVGRGVGLVQEPVDMPFGRWAMFEDGEGNRFPLTAR